MIFAVGLTFFIAVYMTMDAIYLFFNNYIDWWYSAVTLLILGFIYVACYLFIFNCSSKSRKDREKMIVAVILVMVGLVVAYAWETIYFQSIYDERFVYHGVGDLEDPNNYKK